MKDWFALTGSLETSVPPLDQVTERRVWKRVKAALPRKRRRVPLIAAVAAVLLLTACGVAVATGQFSRWFGSISENRLVPEQSEALFAELGTVIGRSQTAGDVTMTLDGALWDGEYLFLSLSVEGLSAEKMYMDRFTGKDSWVGGSKEFMYEQVRELYPRITEEEIEAYWEALKPFRCPEITYICDRETGEHRLLVQKELSGEEAEELTLHLENMEFNGTTVEGPFEFTFTAAPKSITQTYTGDVVVECAGVPAIHISEIRVSPFQVEMDFTAEDGKSQIEVQGMKIGTLLAGERETAGSGSAGLRTYTDDAGHTKYTLRDGPFRQIVDPRAVTSIEINGEWLELEQFTLQE